MTKENRLSGIYLIIDPAMDPANLLHRLEAAAGAGIAAVQIWDHFAPGQDAVALIRQVCSCCGKWGIPVLINNRWELLRETPLDGIHFDEVPDNWKEIRQAVDRPLLAGITCNNDLSAVRWAHRQGLDYISFCSLFPSSTSNSCELVSFDTIRKARAITSMPIFLAGGITPANMPALQGLDFSGVAVVSGIMQSGAPAEAVHAYINQLDTIKK